MPASGKHAAAPDDAVRRGPVRTPRRVVPDGLRGLGSPFWRLFGSSTVSNLGDGMGRTAVMLLAASLTRDPLLISGVETLAFLPWLLFALPSGALVDRMDRRRAMSYANFFRTAMLALLCLAVATDTATIPVLYAITFVIGVVETVYDSAARAILPQVIDRERLDVGNSLMTVEENVGQTFLGAPIGSVLFAVVALAPFLANAVGFALAALLVLTLRGNFRPHRSAQRSVGADMRDGVNWLVQHRFLRGLVLVVGTTSVLQGMVNSVLVLYVLEQVHQRSGAFGIFLAVAGAGGLVGAAAAAPLATRFGRGPTIVAAATLSALSLAVMGMTSSAWLGMGLYGLSAVGITASNVLSMSLRQALIPGELFGRVQGAFRTLIWGGIPIGALLGGALASATSIGTVYVVAGLLMLGTATWLALLLRTYRGHIAAAFGPPPEAAAVS